MRVNIINLNNSLCNGSMDLLKFYIRKSLLSMLCATISTPIVYVYIYGFYRVSVRENSVPIYGYISDLE